MIFKDIEFEVIYSKRRTLAIEVKVGCEVIVRAPKRISEDKIFAFLNKRYDWVLKAVERQANRQNRYDISEEETLKLKKLAAEYIPQRVEYYSKIMGLYPSRVKINSAKTRFGSCSAKNSLNFSFYLMAYPVEAIDYVVVHELAHIKHKNHQKSFYDLIARYLPDYKRRIKMLKDNKDK